jgi:hypothetical protein
MTFTEALSAVFNDADDIRRATWRNRSITLFLDDAKLCTNWNSTTQQVDDEAHPFIVSESDYFADDWEVVEP